MQIHHKAGITRRSSGCGTGYSPNALGAEVKAFRCSGRCLLLGLWRLFLFEWLTLNPNPKP